jgi:hypothetical protein
MDGLVILAAFRRETAKALLIERLADGEEYWVPRSQVRNSEIRCPDRMGGDGATMKGRHREGQQPRQKHITNNPMLSIERFYTESPEHTEGDIEGRDGTQIVKPR